MIKRVSGTLSEIKPLNQMDTEEVIRFEKGDIVRVHGVYAIIDGFFTNERGNRCIRLGLPENPMALQIWAKQNPHRVKLLEAGHHIGGKD